MLFGELGVYLIGGLVGAMACGLFLPIITRSSNSDDAHLIRIFGVIGGATGGFLGVAVIGPIGQLTWRMISDVISADPERSGDYLWPYPVSLWYSALFTGASVGGLWAGLLAALVAKRRLSNARV